MLVPSLAGLGIVTYLASQEGKKALTEAAFNQLTSYRAAKKQQVEWYFRNLRDTFSVLGTDTSVIEAFRDFKAAFKSVGKTPLAAYRRQKLAEHYTQNILPRLADTSGKIPPIEDVLPQEPAALELQSIYITENPHPIGEKHKLVSSPTVNAYTSAHGKHHPWLRRAMFSLGYYDIMLVDGETGDMLYSVVKENDFGTNHISGTFARTHHGRLVRDVLDQRRKSAVKMTDYDFYLGSYNQPQAFVATPIFDGPDFLGVLVAQLSTDAINRFIHNGRHWEQSGLGKTGSAYMAGIKDSLMRSDTREIFEDLGTYIDNLKKSDAFPDNVVARIQRDKTTILHYPINPEPLLEVAKGRSGTMLLASRKGGNVLISYAPLEIPDVSWAILTRMNEDEVLASQLRFNRTVLTVGCTLALLTTLLALGLARYFMKPVNALLGGIERLRKGDRKVSIAVTSRDEFGEVVGAFNAMAADIQARDEVIEGKNKAYTQLLKRIFPETVADRMRQGEANFAQSFHEVTVIYAIVDGLPAANDQESTEFATRILNELVDSFDNEADQHGIEKVKTIGDHYLAVCGLDVARLDHAKRALDFSVALYREVSIANQMNNLDLSLRVGIASGPVQAGLIGNRRFVYDIWGYAASVARRIVYDADLDALRMNADAYAAISDHTGLGDELEVTTKALGTLKTYQYRFKSEARASASPARQRPRAAE